MRAVVTGGAGFIGFTSVRSFAFRFMEADVGVAMPAPGAVDAVAHLASPHWPRDYLRHPRGFGWPTRASSA
jgi:hypothetical protein